MTDSETARCHEWALYGVWDDWWLACLCDIRVGGGPPLKRKRVHFMRDEEVVEVINEWERMRPND